jgi:hypothetical protein
LSDGDMSRSQKGIHRCNGKVEPGGALLRSGVRRSIVLQSAVWQWQWTNQYKHKHKLRLDQISKRANANKTSRPIGWPRGVCPFRRLISPFPSKESINQYSYLFPVDIKDQFYDGQNQTSTYCTRSPSKNSVIGPY